MKKIKEQPKYPGFVVCLERSLDKLNMAGTLAAISRIKGVEAITPIEDDAAYSLALYNVTRHYVNKLRELFHYDIEHLVS